MFYASKKKLWYDGDDKAKVTEITEISRVTLEIR